MNAINHREANLRWWYIEVYGNPTVVGSVWLSHDFVWLSHDFKYWTSTWHSWMSWFQSASATLTCPVTLSLSLSFEETKISTASYLTLRLSDKIPQIPHGHIMRCDIVHIGVSSAYKRIMSAQIGCITPRQVCLISPTRPASPPKDDLRDVSDFFFQSLEFHFVRGVMDLRLDRAHFLFTQCVFNTHVGTVQCAHGNVKSLSQRKEMKIWSKTKRTNYVNQLKQLET